MPFIVISYNVDKLVLLGNIYDIKNNKQTGAINDDARLKT